MRRIPVPVLVLVLLLLGTECFAGMMLVPPYAPGKPQLIFSGLTYDPTTYEAKGVLTGTGSMSLARTTTQYVADWEGIYRDATANMAAWYGARRVRNLAAYSEDPTASAWTKSNITATSNTLTATNANGTFLQTYTGSAVEAIYSVYLYRKTGTGNIDITTNGGTNWTTVTLTGAYKRFVVTGSNLTNPQFGIRIVTSGDAVYIKQNMFENGVGR